MRSGNRGSFNRWLRFRVVAQGFTVAVAVLGGWQVAQERKAARHTGLEEAQAKQEEEEKERKRFDARMQEAVEAHRLETADSNSK
ncbi:hypothetical protein M422DRAFT_247184 [Sphaerobolus stellatus SS14]|nr:hypothetical protein M422DRAFT_247184 [Sphaerobolus stellatus SS14]